MDLSRQLEIWERDEKWDRIINRLEKIKPLGRSPEMNLLLSTAYISSQARRQRKTLKRDRGVLNKILEALALCAEEFKNKGQWNANMGTTLFLLERYGEALPYLQSFLALQGDNIDAEMIKQLAQWIATCQVFIPRPYFKETFPERVKEAWSLFEKQEGEFRRLLDQNQKAKKIIDVNEKVRAVIDIALDGELFRLEKKDDRYRLTLNSTGSLLRLFEAEYFKEHAPKDILKVWDIIVGTTPSDHTKPSLLADSIADETRIWARENNGIFYIDTYSEKASNLSSFLTDQIDPKIREDIELSKNIILVQLFISFIGEPVRYKFIHLSKFLQSPLKEPYLNFTDLPNYLKEHGIDIHATSKSLLNLEVDYAFEPKESKKWIYHREDVISGKTMCMPVLIQFQNGNEYEINKLEADGATAGYIFYGLDNFKGENREKEIAEFRESLKKTLTKKFGPNELKIIGEAHGLNNDYIDVILWNPNKVFESLRILLEGIPKISYSVFQVFRKTSKGLLLTGDKIIKEKFNGTVMQPADMLNPVGIDYPRVPDLE